MTAQEIVRALRCCGDPMGYDGCTDCPLSRKPASECRHMFVAAADLIERLTAELKEAKLSHRTEHCEAADYDCAELGRLRKELAQVKRERDAAVEDLSGCKASHCSCCRHAHLSKTDGICSACLWDNKDAFEWRGAADKQEGGAEDAYSMP